MKRIGVVKFVYLLLALAFCSVCLYLHIRLSNIVVEISDNAVKSKCAIVVSKAIYDLIDKTCVDYESLIFLEKDNNGNITALTTKILPVNKLKSGLSLVILENLREIKSIKVSVPIGNILGVETFSGFGPDVNIKLVPSGNVFVDFENNFDAVGINQTRHQIFLKVKCDVYVMSSTRRKNVSVETSVCIAETVIVGKVPESFTNIDANEGTNSAIDKEDIFNFIY